MTVDSSKPRKYFTCVTLAPLSASTLHKLPVVCRIQAACSWSETVALLGVHSGKQAIDDCWALVQYKGVQKFYDDL